MTLYVGISGICAKKQQIFQAQARVVWALDCGKQIKQTNKPTEVKVRIHVSFAS